MGEVSPVQEQLQLSSAGLASLPAAALSALSGLYKGYFVNVCSLHLTRSGSMLLIAVVST